MDAISLYNQTTLECSKLITERYSTSFTLGIKTLDKVDFDSCPNKIETNVVVKDSSLNGIEGLPTSLRVALSNSEDPLITEVTKGSLPYQNIVAIKFHCENPETLAANLPGYLDNLKELLGEMGPELKDIL